MLDRRKSVCYGAVYMYVYYICGSFICILMGKRIYSGELIDDKTGEVLSSKSYYIDKYSESFIMVRTTLGKEWYYSMSNNEKNLLMMLWDWSSSDMSVYLGTVRRKEVMMLLGIKPRQITAVLGLLCKNDYIKRIGRDDFMVNPEYMFKCSVGEVRKKIKKYREYVV